MNSDFYPRFQSLLHLERWIFVFTTPFIGWLLFLCLPHSKDIPIDWFSLCFGTIAWDASITVLIQLLTGLYFLRPRLKGHSHDAGYPYPISNMLKMTRHRLIALCICIGSLVMFTVFTFSGSSEPVDISIFLGDFFLGVVGTVVIGLWSSLMIDGLIRTFIGKSLIFKFKRSHSDWFLHKNSAHHPFHSDYSALHDDWYNDVTNPASPVHQATYRRSDNI